MSHLNGVVINWARRRVCLCENSAFLRGINEICALLGCYAALIGRGQLKRDGTRAETRFRLSAKRTSPFKSAGGVSSAADYWQPRCAHQLHSPVSPFTSLPVHHSVPSHFNWSLVSSSCTAWPLKMESIGCPQTSVTTLRKISEHRRSYLCLINGCE
jgi:hypothetical protein